MNNMNIEESDKFDGDIKYLSNALVQGFNDCRNFKDRALQTALTDKKLADFIDEIRVELQKWYEDVLKYIIDNLNRNYHQYHFSAQKKFSTTYSGMNEKVSDLITIWEDYLRNLEDIIFRLEDERNLQIRREIAEIENQADIAYEVKYNDHKREISINRFIIAKPDFESENDRFFNYIFLNPNRTISITEIEAKGNGGEKFKKRVSDIVRDLGFKGNLRKVFLPVVTQTKIMLINPISKKYIIDNELPPLNLEYKGDKASSKEVKRGKETKG